MTVDKPRTVIKVRLKEIYRININYQNFHVKIKEVNELINVAYLFMRSFVLYAIENNIDFQINTKFIKAVFKILIKDNKRGKPTKDKNNLKVLRTYLEIFKKETDYQEIIISNISYILTSVCEQIYIAIINNILYHYEKHVRKFIKSSFCNEYQNIMDRYDDKTNRKHMESRKNMLKEFHGQMNKIYEDIINSTQLSDAKYHTWIIDHKTDMIPLSYSCKTFESDVQKNALKYLTCMSKMTNKVNETSKKTYQIFPLKASYGQNHIKINTSALIDLFHSNLDKSYPSKIGCFNQSGNPEFQERIWNDIFQLKNTYTGKYKFRRPMYSFNYEIETDGFTVSLNLIHDSQISVKNKKKENFREGRIESNIKKTEMTSEEYDKYVKNKNEKQIDKKTESKNKLKEKKIQDKNNYKILSDKEKEKIKDKINNSQEFPYIENIMKNDSMRIALGKQWIEGKIVFCDPGKRSPLYLKGSNNVHKINDKDKLTYFGVSNNNNLSGKGNTKHKPKEISKHKFMNYTTKTRVKFTKRKKYARLVENWKQSKPKSVTNKLKKSGNWLNKSVKDLELELSYKNSKSCNHNTFLEYVKLKLELVDKIKYQYLTDYLEKLKWYAYLNKQKHERNLMKKIGNEFGSDATIIIGDWSNKGRIKFTPTPNLSLKRKLKEHFTVYHINEYNTSRIHYKTNEKCNNMSIPVKIKDEKSIEKTVLKQLHAVLTSKIVSEEFAGKNTSFSCINRDKNSVLNMDTIFQSLLSGKGRPSQFTYIRLDHNKRNLKMGKPSNAKSARRGQTKTNKQLSSTINSNNLRNPKIENKIITQHKIKVIQSINELIGNSFEKKSYVVSLNKLLKSD